MPTYDWRGRTPSGGLASGSIDAPTKEEATRRLREQSITLLSLAEMERGIAGTARRLWPRFVIGLALLAGAPLMLTISRGTTIRCSGGDCSVETTIAGVYPLYAEDVQHARRAGLEERLFSSRDVNTRKTSSLRKTRIVLAGDRRTVNSEWLAYPLPRTKSVTRSLNEWLSGARTQPFQSRQVESPPLAVAAVLAIVGLWIFVAAFRASV